MMQYGKIDGIAKPVSRLGQGTMLLKEDDLNWSFQLLDDIYSLGCNLFDTARVYGHGKSDRVLGQWIRDRGLQDQVVVLAKGCHHSALRKKVTYFDLSTDLYDSLAEMKLDRVDLYLLHRDDPAYPVGLLVEEFNKHWKDGKIGAFGGSNWTHPRLAEAWAYAEAHGLRPMNVSSPNFSLADQVESPWGPDCISISGPKNAETRRWYAERDFPVIAWSSLARGFFAGNISRDDISALANGPDRSSVKAYCHETNFRRLDRVQILAREKGLSVPQIAMAWVMNQPLNLFCLIGCYNKEQFQQNLEASTLKLTQEEIDWLDLRRDDR